MAQERRYLETHTVQADQQVFDLQEQIQKLRPLPPDRQHQGVALVHQSGLNMVLTVANAGADLGEPQPKGPTTMQVLDGSLRIRMDGEESVLKPGMVVAFDANVRRDVTALEDSAILTAAAITENAR